MYIEEAKVLMRKAARSDLGTDDLLLLASDDSEEEGRLMTWNPGIF